MDATATRAPQQAHQERSLPSLFSDLWRETATLFRDEAELAKVEMSEKVSQVQSGATSLAIGGAVLYAGFLMLLAAAAAGLALALPEGTGVWAGPLIVGAVVAIIGAILLANARKKLKAQSLTPTRTVESMRGHAQFAKDHIR